MAMKIALIVALCVSQGFAVKPFFGKEKRPCNHPLPESAEIIPHEFEETVNEMDDFRETVSAAILESQYKGTDPKVVIACFDQQRENYTKLGEKLANKIRQGAQELAEDLGDNYENFVEQASAPFKKIAETMQMLPERMWEYIKDNEFTKALEVYRESRRIIEENARILAKLTKEFTEELPEAAEKAEKLAKEVREDARRGCETIAKAFRKCVKEGGPKTQFEVPEPY